MYDPTYMLLLGGVDVLEVCGVAVGRLAVGRAAGLLPGRRRRCRRRHVGVELGGRRRRLRRVRRLGRAPVGAVLLVTLQNGKERN